MMARISISSAQLTTEQLQLLQDFFGEPVAVEELVYLDSDETKAPIQFYSWRHTKDPAKVQKDIHLVHPAGVFQPTEGKEYLCADVERFLDTFPSIGVTMKGIKHRPVDTYGLGEMLQHLQLMSSRMEKLTTQFDRSVEFNERCEVHISNLGMLNINSVGLLENGCTDRLQEVLLQGWRLLAICPQPDNRRPDYVLGRHLDDAPDVRCIRL